jgi:hypothetical protein
MLRSISDERMRLRPGLPFEGHAGGHGSANAKRTTDRNDVLGNRLTRQEHTRNPIGQRLWLRLLLCANRSHHSVKTFRPGVVLLIAVIHPIGTRKTAAIATARRRSHTGVCRSVVLIKITAGN